MFWKEKNKRVEINKVDYLFNRIFVKDKGI